MNTSSQFPPSSPLLNNELESEPDVFDNLCSAKSIFSDNWEKEHIKRKFKEIDNKVDAYITPDPSSSLGDVTLNSEKDGDEHNEPSVHAIPNSEKNVKKQKVSISKLDISQPLNQSNFKNVIQIPLNGDIFKIGRSGLSCSFKLNSKNRLISRVHAEVQYDKESNLILLKCLGYNGLNITIPQLVNIDHLKDQEYLVSINGEGQEEVSNSRILTQSDAFTNFYMLKGESIKMPMIVGTVLDFRGDLALLVYNKHNLDLINTPEQFNSSKDKAANPKTPVKMPRKLSTEQLLKIVEQKKLQFSTHPTLAELKNKKSHTTTDPSGPRPIEKRDLANTIIYKRPSPIPFENSPPEFENGINDYAIDDEHDDSLDDETPEIVSPLTGKENKHINLPPKPTKRKVLGDITNVSTNVHNSSSNTQSKISLPKKPEEPKSQIPQEIKQIKESKIVKDVKKQAATSSPVSGTAIKTTKKERSKTPEVSGNSDIKDEKTVAEHKKKGRPKKTKQTEEDVLRSMPKEEIESVLSTVPELDDISNLITNHIAYSRVLQTPFSSIIDLNSIKKHSLTKLQLRCILIHSIDCIGVIFRQGKDAAGKPLDEEYYYIPEKDSDLQRVKLVEELKGSSSHLRSCRKTHKQYFWKKPKI